MATTSWHGCFAATSWLRAQASSGHSLSLGFMLAIAFGFSLYLFSQSATLRTRLAIGLVFWLGLVSAYSRGPWIGAVLIALAYSALKPRAITRLFKAGFVLAIVLGALSLSPMGEELLNSLPFASGRPDANFVYRQRLLDRSLELIQEHPLFGDQLAIQKMEDLRQGQGIIDIVNTYVGVALFSGWVGLALFLGFILERRSGRIQDRQGGDILGPGLGLARIQYHGMHFWDAVHDRRLQSDFGRAHHVLCTHRTCCGVCSPIQTDASSTPTCNIRRPKCT